jgi:hypothetical protein
MKAARRQAACLEPSPGAARAEIVSAEFLDEFLLAVNDSIAALDAAFRVKSRFGVCSSIDT